MFSLKTIIRIIIWSFVVLCIAFACFLYYLGDINKLKGAVETNLKNQLNCTIKLGDLDWDWYGFKLGVTTKTISIFDKENNIILQGGQTRFVWHLKSLITGAYAHFYAIESTNLYLNAIRNKQGIWNFIAVFPPGPPPKVDNLRLNNSIIYLVDELNPANKTVLYKDLNLDWERKLFSRLRRIDLGARIGSLTSPSFLRVKGSFTEAKKFDWKKSQINLSIVARQLDLANWHGYFNGIVKEPQIKYIGGKFTGVIYLSKKKNDKILTVKSRTNTNDFLIELQKDDVVQLIEIPKTDFVLRAFVDKNTIIIEKFKSHIDELTYELTGKIFNWSKNLPDVDLILKTNNFNFKSVKPYLPLSLLPASTRSRIEPINDDGLVEIDIKLKGPLIAPQYFGTILLKDFNLTAESGFLNVIQGLEGKLVLDNELLKIDKLIIPIEGSPLILNGEINSEEEKTSFNLSGKDLTLRIIQDLLLQITSGTSFLNEISTDGKLDLNLDVLSEKNNPPDIKGKLIFHDASLSIFKEEPMEVKNLFGELSLDGSKVLFNKVTGLINNENFSIQGDFSLKEDEKINLSIDAKRLKVIPYILSFLAAKTPFKPIAKTVSGEASDLDLKVGGVFSKPVLDGMVLINNISFSLPNLTDKISNVSGGLKCEGTQLIIEDLNGKIQNADFSVNGYIEDLFSSPKPKLRLVTGDIEISSFWNYLKDQLKTTSLSTQANELEKLSGLASVDIFLYPDLLLGNIYFKDGQIKYKSLPFGLDSLVGRLVIGEKNLSLFGLMGAINQTNNFNCDLIVSDYLNPQFRVQGYLTVDLDLPSLLKAINAPSLNTVKVDGLIPTAVNFDFSEPIVNLAFYSTLDEMLQLDLPPYIKKPSGKSYLVSGKINFDTKDMNLVLDDFNIKTDKLSLTTNGSIKNISSKTPVIMLNFSTDEPNGIFMIVEPIVPLMGYKIYGTIELSGSVSGTPTMYSVSGNANVTDLMMPDILGKKLTASDGMVKLYLDEHKGFFNSQLNNVNYVSLNAKSISLSADYKNPIIYLKEFSLDGNPGSIYATGSYNPKDSSINLNANASDLDLSGLGAFIFLDPTKLAGRTNFALMISGSGKNKDEIIANTNGNLSFSVNDGKLAQVALLQKGLQVANLFSQGIFGFNLKNVLSLFFKYQDGSFNTITGELDLKDGKIKAKEFNYRAKDLFLNSFGFVDLINSFVGLSFYGYLPEQSGEKEQKQKSSPTSVISIVPNAFGQKRFFIPFLSSTSPKYFKFEVKGDIKKPKKITSHARRSFKWLRGNKLKKEFKYVPKAKG